MNERINDKIEEIEKYLGELLEIIPSSLVGYGQDFKAKAACERYAERIIEAVVDLVERLMTRSSFLRLRMSSRGMFGLLLAW
jgi:uncharacterized protein YutE (UPF0331/DUF86 family)